MKTVIVCVLVALVATLAMSVQSASGHRSGCHRGHTCPSDHATYRWRGLLCVKPSSSERDSSFERRVRHAGLTYYCKR